MRNDYLAGRYAEKRMTLRAMMLMTAGLMMAVGAEAPLPALHAEPVAEGSALRIRNTGTAPLTAFVIEMVGYPGSRFRMAQDEVWGKPIPPGAEREYRVGSLMPGTVPDYLKVRAAIYADGSTAGTPDQIALLIDDRRRRLRGLRAILAHIAGDNRADLEAARLAADLSGWKESMEPELRFVADIVISRLKNSSTANVVEESKAMENALAASKPQLR